MLAVVCIAAALLALWCLLLLPRRGQPGWEAIGRARYAHRGLHSLTAGRPENSMAGASMTPAVRKIPCPPSARRRSGALARSWTST